MYPGHSLQIVADVDHEESRVKEKNQNVLGFTHLGFQSESIRHNREAPTNNL